MSAVLLPVRRRSPPDGGYVRGEETRRRIVKAALEIFAEEGFAKASTRRIAAAAGVNPPALQYYFDSKEGLHRACADLIIENVLARLEPVLSAGRSAAAADADSALDALCDLVDVVVDMSLASGETPVWRRFIAWTHDDNTGGGHPRIKVALGAPTQAMARTLVARATGRGEDEEIVRLRALLLLGQVSSFHTNRQRVIEAAGWSDLDDAGVSAIKAVVREHTRAVILAARDTSNVAFAKGHCAQ